MSTFYNRIFRTKPLAVIHAEEASTELQRTLSLFDLICIGVGCTIGTGVFATTGTLISTVAGPAAVISWIIAGVVAIFNAFAYMELATRVPSSGSVYAYAYHTMGELPAVVAAWMLTLEYGISGAGIARSWAQKMEEWLNDDYKPRNFHYLNEQYANIFAVIVMVFCVGILLLGIKFGKAFVNTVATVKAAVVAFIIVAGFAYMDTEYLAPFVPERNHEKSAFGFQGVVSAASLAFYGYTGFDEVCCLAAEVKNPKKIMPIAVITVVLITMFLSCFSSFVLSGLVHYTEAVSFSAGFNAQGAKWAATIVHAGEVGTMPLVVLVSLLAQPRINYALACDGLLPRIFAKVNSNGVLFVNTVISGVLLTAIAFCAPFSTLWDIVSFGIFLVLNMAQLSLLMVRTTTASPKAAPRTIGVMFFSGFISTFAYQIGWVNHGLTAWYVIALLFFAVYAGSVVYYAVKLPQEPNDAENYSAPLVPFIPAAAMLANFYLMAQLTYLGIELSLAWVAASILSYFAYGYGNAVSRDNWAKVLSYVPNDVYRNSLHSPMLSVNEGGVPASNAVLLAKEKSAANV
jgi:amino acid transporter